MQTVVIKEMRQNLGVNSQICTNFTCPAANYPYKTSIKAQLNKYQKNITDLNGKLTNLTGESPQILPCARGPS
jgi:hypothetical protein